MVSKPDDSHQQHIPQGPAVHGLDVTPLTQCTHWNSERDVIAIKHKCCGQYYACISCHNALAQHPPDVWPQHERHSKAILCGKCRAELTIEQYMSCGNICPSCGAAFNPGCSLHYDLYFEMDGPEVCPARR
ncbi:Helper of Tim protein 13 [Cytospora mali]|uniref:Helper of Tim protein 13 n=1 Tax=Cytospora mali TaxID=578113 RepID=A0A194VBU7_CYTMA|nr:Helper of Tim protein 13 [Valsa mali var. pyri (nom. inval.)]